MGRNRLDQLKDIRKRSDKPCWHELLAATFTGLYPSDQNLEQMLDHLERAA